MPEMAGGDVEALDGGLPEDGQLILGVGMKAGLIGLAWVQRTSHLLQGIRMALAARCLTV